MSRTALKWKDFQDHYDAMTLGEATVMRRCVPFACACVGPPMPSPPGTPCFCRLNHGQAQYLRHSAQVVVKLLDDLAKKYADRIKDLT